MHIDTRNKQFLYMQGRVGTCYVTNNPTHDRSEIIELNWKKKVKIKADGIADGIETM